MKGSYILIIELKYNSIIPIGKNKERRFCKGYYIYVGSALNGLSQRIQRHMRKQKKIHWHIDYLLKHARIINVFYKKSTIREECNIARKLERILILIPDFGNSDCNCRSHLFYGSFREIMYNVEKLNMDIYTKNANY